MKLRILIAVAAPFLGSISAVALPTKHRVIAEVPGYTCVMLKLTDAQRMDFAHTPQFKSEPSDEASNIAPLTGQVAIRDGVPPTNGYAAAINFAGKRVWAPTAFLTPYHVESEPNTRCQVVKYSDGTYGFTYLK